MSILPPIGRAHLDDAIKEGRAAACNPTVGEETCPYSSHDQPMTRHAWLRGFREARESGPAKPANVPFAATMVKPT